MAKRYRTDPKGRILNKGENFVDAKKLYRYTYTDSQGKRKSIYSKDLVSLRDKEKNIFKDILDGIDTYVAGSATVNYVFDRYISMKTDLKSTTVWNYTYTYNYFVREGFGKKKISQVKYSDVIMFYNALIDRGLNVSTVDNIHTVLHPTFQLAVRDDIIRKNPTDNALSEIKRNNKDKINTRHALTMDQQRACLDYINSPEYMSWKPLFIVMFGTGCRVGEIIGLRWEDVDFDNRMISINHNVTYSPRVDNSNKSEFRVSLPKTKAGIRTIPLLDEVQKVLMREKERQEETGDTCLTELNGMSGFIFFNRFHSIHNPASINRAIKRILINYNTSEEVKARKEHREPIMIPNFSCHIIRHTFCTRLCENESNIKVIQSVMGHKDIQTTLDIYAEVSDQKKLATFDGLNQVGVI